MPKPTLKDIYRPSHDEAARHAFVGALKGYVNGPWKSVLPPLRGRIEARLRSETRARA